MSIAAIRESVIRAGLDASGYEAGARRVQAANISMAASGERVAATQEKTTRTTVAGAGAVERLQRELDRTYQAQRRFETAQDRISQATQRGLISQARGSELLELARTRYLGAGQAAQTAADGVSRFGAAGGAALGAVEGMTSRLGALGGALSALGPIGIGVGVVLSTIGAALVPIAQAGDAATAAIARLVAATGSMADARAAYQGLYEISARTGVAIADSAATFQRFRIAAGEIGATNAQVLRLVEGLQKAAVVSGAVGQEGSAAMMQLGQALASGRLNGDELRSVMENMPSLAQALARELGTNIGQLRQMGEEGTLTADRVFPALLRATEKMGQEFDRMPLTMARAFGILGVEMTKFAESLNEALGVSEAIAQAVKAAADAVRGVRRATMPTAEERAANDVAEGERRIAAAQARLRGAEPDIAAYEAAGLSRQQAMELAVPALPGAKSVAQEMAEGEAILRRGLQAQFEIRSDAAERENRASEEAARKATEAARGRASAALEEDRLKHDKLEAAAKAHAERLKVIDDAAAAGVTTVRDHATGGRKPFDAAAERAKAMADYREELRKLREAEDRDSVKTVRSLEREERARDKVLAKHTVELSARQRMLEALGQGEAAVVALNDQIAVENALREAGIPVTGRRTEAEEKYAAAIEETVRANEAAKRREREIVEARVEAKRELDRTAREIETQARRVSDDVATSLFEGIVEGRRGQNVLAWFGNLFKRIAIQAASTQIFLPITTGIIGSMPGLFGIGASGAVGGGGMLSGLGDLLGLSNLLPGGGLGGLFSGALGATAITGWGTSTSAALGAMGGAYGPASLAQLNAFGGGGLMGGAGATFGQLLGGAGAGFGAGMLLNGLLGGNQTGGMIGSGLGSGLGALLGSLTPLGPLGGALIGGLLGGGGGGLFGPGESVKGWSYAIKAANPNPAYGDAFGDQIRMDDVFYNESGKAQFDQANAAIAQINEFLAARGLTVRGARAVGGNKDGPDASWGGAASFNDAFAALTFGSRDPAANPELAASLAGRSFADPGKLQEWVDGFLAAQQAIEALTAEPVAAFQAQLDALNASFDAAVETARRYGLAEDGLTTARDRALAALEAQRAETLRQTSVDLALRRMVAGGGGLEADLAQQAENARREVAAFTAALDALGLSAAERAAHLVDLEETQAAERAAIIRRYGEEAAAALRQAGGTIRQYLDRLASGTAAGASPTDRLAAAQAQFDRDRTLSMGGDRDALGRITGSADALLSAGRDMFASSPDFQAILAGVRGGLEGLPVLQSYDAMQAASLEAIQAAIESGTLNTATTILPGGNIVSVSNMADLGGLSATITALSATTLQVGGVTHQGLAVLADSLHGLHTTAVQQAASLISLGVYLAAANVFAHDLNWRVDHLQQLGEAINGNVQFGNKLTADNTVSTAGALAALSKVAADMHTGLAAILTAGNSIANVANIHLVNGFTALHAVGSATNIHLVNGFTAGHAAQSAANVIAVDAAKAQAASIAALNQITVDASAASTTSLALANTLLAGILAKPVPANDNTTLAAILAATQAGTAHGLVTAGQIQVVANRAHSAVLHIATHQQYTLQGNARIAEARDAQLAGNALAASQIARLVDLNTSLGTIDRSARDVNASLATVDARVAAVQAAQSAGNAIAVDAAARIIAALGAQNVIAANQNATLLVALNAGNVIAVDAARATVEAQNAGNLITAGGANATVAAMNAGNSIQATYYGQNMAQMQALIAEMQAMRAELAQLRTATQQGAAVVAQETRSGAQMVAARVEQVDDTLRRNAA